MTRFDLMLSKLTIVCLTICVVVFGVKYYCEWTAIRMLTFTNDILKGRQSNALFERVPILPDRIVFDSTIPDTIVFGYLGGRCGLLRYSRVNIIVRGGVIEDAFGVQ